MRCDAGRRSGSNGGGGRELGRLRVVRGRRHAGFLLSYELWLPSGNRCQGCDDPTKSASPRPADRRRTNNVGTSRRRRPPIGLPSDTVFRLSVTAVRPLKPRPLRASVCLSISGPRPHKRSQPLMHPRCRDESGWESVRTHSNRVTCYRRVGLREHADNRNTRYKAAWKVGDEVKVCVCLCVHPRDSIWQCTFMERYHGMVYVRLCV